MEQFTTKEKEFIITGVCCISFSILNKAKDFNTDAETYAALEKLTCDRVNGIINKLTTPKELTALEYKNKAVADYLKRSIDLGMPL